MHILMKFLFGGSMFASKFKTLLQYGEKFIVLVDHCQVAHSYNANKPGQSFVQAKLHDLEKIFWMHVHVEVIQITIHRLRDHCKRLHDYIKKRRRISMC